LRRRWAVFGMGVGDTAEIFEGADVVLGDAVTVGVHLAQFPLRDGMAAFRCSFFFRGGPPGGAALTRAAPATARAGAGRAFAGGFFARTAATFAARGPFSRGGARGFGRRRRG